MNDSLPYRLGRFWSKQSKASQMVMKLAGVVLVILLAGYFFNPADQPRGFLGIPGVGSTPMAPTQRVPDAELSALGKKMLECAKISDKVNADPDSVSMGAIVRACYKK